MRILKLDGSVEYMNDHGLALLEIDTFARNRGAFWADLWPEESRADLLRSLEIAREGGVATFVAFCPTAKGKPRWWSTVVSPVLDEDGSVARLLAISRDITAERRREERRRAAVRRARQAAAAKIAWLAYLRQALEALPAGLALYDADDRLIMWNREYLLAGGGDPATTNLREGMTFEELLRLDLADGRHPEADGREEEWIAERLQARARGGEPQEQRLTNGAWYRFEDRRLPDGGFVAVAVDITGLKDREAAAREAARQLAEAKAVAEAASAAKSEFLANMSHEIRTPLNGVVGMADLLSRADLGPRERKIAGIIRASGETLERLLSDILDLARIESGGVAIEHAVFDLGELVRDVVALSGPRATEKGIVLDCRIDPEVAGAVEGDPTRLRQILTNLLSNAIKFTEAGRVDLHVGREGPAVRFRVTDTGVGFDPAAKERLFRRFEQADGSITRRFGGSGLGLAICRQLAALMGGTLDCDSVPGQGSSFWVDLPLASVEGSAEGPAGQPEAPPLDQRMRILIADDHPTNRTVVELILSNAGAETVCVEDGVQAVEAVTNGIFDIVLMDMQMPVLDGLSAIRRIREWEGRQGRPALPILMLTANTLPDHVRAAAEAGADGHVSKPVTAARLLASIERAIGQAAGENASVRAQA